MTSDGVKAYVWDAENRLVEVQQGGNTLATFGYDGVGRRAAKSAGGTTTSFVYDGVQFIEVRPAGGTMKRYFYGLGIDRPLAEATGAATNYFSADHLGSVTPVTDAAGAPTLNREYDAWGNLLQGGAASGYAITGREWDAETNLYCCRARYYDPKTGRFLSEDPIGFEGGDINFYAYVWNDPTDFSDPTGLGAWKPPDPSPTPSPIPTPSGPAFTIGPPPPPQSDCLWTQYFNCFFAYYGHVASETPICTLGLKRRWGIPALVGAGGCSLVGLYGLRELCIKKAFEQCGTCPPPKRQPPRRLPRPPLNWSPDGRPPVRNHR